MGDVRDGADRLYCRLFQLVTTGDRTSRVCEDPYNIINRIHFQNGYNPKAISR